MADNTRIENLKAYAVSDGEDGTIVVFSPYAVTARREGANHFSIDFGEVDYCRRTPEFDRFAPGPVPAEALLDAGWWQSCRGCECRCSLDGDDEYGDPLDEPMQLVFDGTDVWCSAACRAVQWAEQLRRRRAIIDLCEVVLTKWPQARIVHAHVYDRLEPKRPHHGNVAYAAFTLPGLEAQATWHFGDSTISLAQRDLDAYRALYQQAKPHA